MLIQTGYRVIFWFQDGQFKVDWASQAYCNFSIFVAVVMFVISLVQFWRFVKFFRRGRDSRYLSQYLAAAVALTMRLLGASGDSERSNLVFLMGLEFGPPRD